jgi:elongation factor P
MISTTDFRKGLKIEIDNEPYVIVEFQHVKPGKGGAFVRTKIKHMISGRVLDPTFRSGDKVGKPDLESVSAQFLYADGEDYHFMNTSNYEQIPMPRETLGDTTKFLKEEMKVDLLIYNGQPINVELPNFVELLVTQADPGLKGDTASGAQKPVTLETGLQVNVPLFINEGDILKIDTRSSSYSEKVNK